MQCPLLTQPVILNTTTFFPLTNLSKKKKKRSDECIALFITSQSIKRKKIVKTGINTVIELPAFYI